MKSYGAREYEVGYHTIKDAWCYLQPEASWGFWLGETLLRKTNIFNHRDNRYTDGHPLVGGDGWETFVFAWYGRWTIASNFSFYNITILGRSENGTWGSKVFFVHTGKIERNKQRAQ